MSVRSEHNLTTMLLWLKWLRQCPWKMIFCEAWCVHLVGSCIFILISRCPIAGRYSILWQYGMEKNNKKHLTALFIWCLEFVLFTYRMIAIFDLNIFHLVVFYPNSYCHFVYSWYMIVLFIFYYIVIVFKLFWIRVWLDG